MTFDAVDMILKDFVDTCQPQFSQLPEIDIVETQYKMRSI
jgi:hypothetical protein